MFSSFLRASAVLCVLAASPVLAAPDSNVPANATATPSESARALALQLSQAAQPTEMLLDAILAGYDQGFSQEHAADPAMDEIEREFPGFMEKLRVRGREELAKVMAERAPGLHRRIADVYAANLDEQQMAEVLAFVRTPTGAKLIREIALAPSEHDSADDLNLTAEEVETEGLLAAAKAARQLTPDERVQVMKFSASPAGLAFQRLNGKVSPVVAAEMNDLMADFTRRIEPITLELLESYSKPAA